MKERAEAIGADFGLESKPGFGTKITVSLETLEG
jgi:signal transduction histidine kinase